MKGFPFTIFSKNNLLLFSSALSDDEARVIILRYSRALPLDDRTTLVRSLRLWAPLDIIVATSLLTSLKSSLFPQLEAVIPSFDNARKNPSLKTIHLLCLKLADEIEAPLPPASSPVLIEAFQRIIQLEASLTNLRETLADDREKANTLCNRIISLVSDTPEGQEDSAAQFIAFHKDLVASYPSLSHVASLKEIPEFDANASHPSLSHNGSLEEISEFDPDAMHMLGMNVVYALDYYQAQAAPPGIETPRYLNAGFFLGPDQQFVPANNPLVLANGHYTLGVNVGESWGPGTQGEPFPESILKPYFNQSEELKLEVQVRSPDITIEPSHDTLRLGRRNNSEMIFFGLTLNRSGLCDISVDLLYQGHLLQSRCLNVQIIPQAGAPLPESGRPAQDGRTTFTQSVAINPEDVSTLNDRLRNLTILIESGGETIRLMVYDRSGAELGRLKTELNLVELKQLLEDVRICLAEMVDKYRNFIGSSEDMLLSTLGPLADKGRTLCRKLLPDQENQDYRPSLPYGAVIQVAPLSPKLNIPWEIIYDRKIERFRQDRITLCKTFKTHGPNPEDCPNHDDPRVICPYGFWGFRYIIEQIPGYITKDDKKDGHLQRQDMKAEVHNSRPLILSVIYSAKLNNTQEHLNHLVKLVPGNLVNIYRLSTLDALQEMLNHSNNTADIIYFYTHGGQEAGSSYLEVGSDRVTENDFDAWEINLTANPPLVFLNACESADYSLDDYESLAKQFYDMGAAGVIGTQCITYENLADTFGRRFFSYFYRQVTVGEALFNLRWDLLREECEPRGLIYSLFASADVRLSIPVEPPTQSSNEP